MPESPAKTTLSLSVPFHIEAEAPEGGGPFPVVLALHGYAMDAPTMRGLARRLVPAGVLLVVPQGPHSTLVPGTEQSEGRRIGFHWGVSEEPRETRALHRAAVAAAIDWAAARGGDSARVALLGFSQPCSFDYRLALDPPHGKPFAAVVGICGGIPGEWPKGEGRATAASRATDALHVSTLDDPFYAPARIASFSARLAERFRCAGHLVLPGGHRVPSAAGEPVRRFLAGALSL